MKAPELLGFLAMAATATSCSTGGRVSPTWPEHSLSIEMCFPASLDLKGKRVDVHEVGETSAGGGITRQVGTTLENQPIYRSEISFYERDKAAIIHVDEEGGGGKAYVIVTPVKQALKTDVWSEWASPDYLSSLKNPDLALLYGAKASAYGVEHARPLDADAPRVRYLRHDSKAANGWLSELRMRGPQNGMLPC